jgi:regulator of nucleoside diphosphate kinase
MSSRTIYITDHDYTRLQKLIESLRWFADGHAGNLGALELELRRAKIVESAQIPSDVVTMNTTVRVRDLESGDVECFMLVFPTMADWESNRISILAPVGIAILGCRAGDEIECPAPSGVRRLRLEEVLDQPERSGIEESSAPGSGRFAPTAHEATILLERSEELSGRQSMDSGSRQPCSRPR